MKVYSMSENCVVGIYLNFKSSWGTTLLDIENN